MTIQAQNDQVKRSTLETTQFTHSAAVNEMFELGWPVNEIVFGSLINSCKSTDEIAKRCGVDQLSVLLLRELYDV